MSDLVTSLNDIIEIPITDAMIDFAHTHTHEGAINDYSMLKGERNFEGVLGELGAYKFLHMMEYMPGSKEQYDLKLGALTVDVKNKHVTNVTRSKRDLMYLPCNECSIFGYESTKSCKIYLFTTTFHDLKVVHIKGWIFKEEFVIPERFYPAGSPMEGTSKTFNKDNYLIRIKELRKASVLKEMVLRNLTKLKSAR